MVNVFTFGVVLEKWDCVQNTKCHSKGKIIDPPSIGDYCISRHPSTIVMIGYDWCETRAKVKKGNLFQHFCDRLWLLYVV